jgi:hypothetical protein
VQQLQQLELRIDQTRRLLQDFVLGHSNLPLFRLPAELCTNSLALRGVLPDLPFGPIPRG